MTIEKVPVVGFYLPYAKGRNAREQLARKLYGHLVHRLEDVEFPIPLIQRFLRCTKILVSVDGKRIDVAVSRFPKPTSTPEDQRPWRLIIEPFLLRRSSKVEKEYASGLLTVSEHIHAFLLMMPGVKGLRWCFRGWAKVPTVAAPARLPWDMEPHEIEQAQARVLDARARKVSD